MLPISVSAWAVMETEYHDAEIVCPVCHREFACKTGAVINTVYQIKGQDEPECGQVVFCSLHCATLFAQPVYHC